MSSATLDRPVAGRVLPTDTTDVAALGSAQTIDAMLHARQRAWIEEATSFMLAAHYADLHADADTTGIALPGAEGTRRMGDDGTPEVAEFAPLEIAAALTVSVEAATMMVGDALSLRHRFPQLWNLMGVGFLRVSIARRIVELAQQLPLAQARELDHRLAPLVDGLSPQRLLTLTEGHVLDLLPADIAEHRRAVAAESRHVEIGGNRDGLAGLWAVLDSADARFLDSQVNRIATILQQGGSTESHNARRALALGVLASPARAVQLIQASLTDQIPGLVTDEDLDVTCPARGQRGHHCGTITVDPEQLLPKAELVVHISHDTACENDGIARVEHIGPVIAESLRTLLADTRLTVRPVIDSCTIAPSDRYEIPVRMRRIVELRNPVEVFPGSRKPAGRCDLDHTIAWQSPGTARRQPPDPPGQHSPGGLGPPTAGTQPGNLAPLSRTVHRAKTHGGWRYQTVLPGCYLWRSPDGFGYLVTPQRSWLIHNPVT